MRDFKKSLFTVKVLFVAVFSLAVLQTHALAENPDGEKKSSGVIPQGNPHDHSGLVDRQNAADALANTPASTTSAASGSVQILAGKTSNQVTLQFTPPPGAKRMQGAWGKKGESLEDRPSTIDWGNIISVQDTYQVDQVLWTEEGDYRFYVKYETDKGWTDPTQSTSFHYVPAAKLQPAATDKINLPPTSASPFTTPAPPSTTPVATTVSGNDALPTVADTSKIKVGLSPTSGYIYLGFADNGYSRMQVYSEGKWGDIVAYLPAILLHESAFTHGGDYVFYVRFEKDGKWTEPYRSNSFKVIPKTTTTARFEFNQPPSGVDAAVISSPQGTLRANNGAAFIPTGGYANSGGYNLGDGGSLSFVPDKTLDLTKDYEMTFRFKINCTQTACTGTLPASAYGLVLFDGFRKSGSAKTPNFNIQINDKGELGVRYLGAFDLDPSVHNQFAVGAGNYAVGATIPYPIDVLPTIGEQLSFTKLLAPVADQWYELKVKVENHRFLIYVEKDRITSASRPLVSRDYLAGPNLPGDPAWGIFGIPKGFESVTADQVIIGNSARIKFDFHSYGPLNFSLSNRREVQTVPAFNLFIDDFSLQASNYGGGVTINP